MNRLEKVCKVVDDILKKQSNLSERHNGYVHLYGVASNCSLLALKRGLNPELCSIAGMLHDISRYKNGSDIEHANLSSLDARKIMNEIKGFDAEEINIVCSAISKHSNKEDIGDYYDEVLKDADVLSHYLNRSKFQVEEKERDRLNKLFKELGIKE
jgi:uncharacterized protein